MRARALTLLSILAAGFAARALFLAATELDAGYYLPFAGLLVAGGLLLGLTALLTKHRRASGVRTSTIVLATISTGFLGVTTISLDHLASSLSGAVRTLAILIQSLSGTLGCGFAVLAAWRAGRNRRRARTSF